MSTPFSAVMEKRTLAAFLSPMEQSIVIKSSSFTVLSQQEIAALSQSQSCSQMFFLFGLTCIHLPPVHRPAVWTGEVLGLP